MATRPRKTAAKTEAPVAKAEETVVDAQFEETAEQEAQPEESTDAQAQDAQPVAAEAVAEVAAPIVPEGSDILNNLLTRRGLNAPIPQMLISIDKILTDYVDHMNVSYPQTDDGLFRYMNELTRVLVMATNHQDAPVGILGMELITDYFRAHKDRVFSAQLMFRTSKKISRLSPAYGMYSNLCLYFEACARCEDRREVSKRLAIGKLIESMTTDTQRSRLAAFIG